MSNDPPSQDEVRDWLLTDIDPRMATIHYATEGMVSTTDLWWLYEEYRIMAPASAWLLAAMWKDELDEELIDKTLSNPAWWRWFDHGPLDAEDRDN